MSNDPLPHAARACRISLLLHFQLQGVIEHMQVLGYSGYLVSEHIQVPL